MKININLGVLAMVVNAVSIGMGNEVVIPWWLCVVLLIAQLKLKWGK